MTFLPVVERELRVAARRRGTYWSRLAAVIIGWAAGFWLLGCGSGGNAQSGALVFKVLAVLVFAYSALAGLLATSDCLSEEKREGTLGLLFLTDLKGYDVVFGKLASTSLKNMCEVLAVAPALALSVVLGGVTGGEVVRVVVAAVNLLFFSLSAGLFASAVCRQDNRSVGLAALLSTTLLVGIPALARIPFLHLPHPDAAFILSPAFGCCSAFDALFNRFPHAWFWLNALMTQAYAWSLLGLACRIVPRSWQDSSATRKVRQDLVKVKSAHSTAQRRKVLAINAFLWRVAGPGRRVLPVWLALLALAALWFAIERVLPLKRFDVTKDILALLLAGVVLKVWLALAASATLSTDRRNATLELLLTTPLAEKEILIGQRLALWRQFAEPAAAVLLANVFLLIMEVIRQPPSKSMNYDFNLLVGLHVLTAVSLVTDLLALSWVAMWQGLVRRKPNRAALVALLEILLVPYMLIPLFAMESGSVALNGFSVLIFPSMFGLASGFYFALSAHTNLAEWFRFVVSEGAPPKFNSLSEAGGVPALEEAK